MKKIVEWPTPGSVWLATKLHGDTAVETEITNTGISSVRTVLVQAKDRPSLILSEFPKRNGVRMYLSVYLTHEGLRGYGVERIDVIDCGTLIDDTQSFAEIPPVALPGNLIKKKIKEIERLAFQSIRKKVSVSLYKP